MLIRFNLISIFENVKVLFVFSILALIYSCQDAKYTLDNPFDPENMNLDPPALFFHPFEVTKTFGESVVVEIYGLELDPASAAHLDIRYDWGSVKVDSVLAGPFFEGENDPIEITVDEQGVLDIFIYYLPDMISNQNLGGTWSLATVYFSTVSTGESELLFGENTTLRDENNISLEIRQYGSGYINVE